MLKFHPYSILTGQTMVRFVIYYVLKDPGSEHLPSLSGFLSNSRSIFVLYIKISGLFEKKSVKYCATTRFSYIGLFKSSIANSRALSSFNFCKFKRPSITYFYYLARLTYSKVPNNSPARLLIFKIFSYQHGLIWTYTLIKIQIIFLPTRLLITIFYFFYLISMLFASIMYFFMYFHPFISV